MLNYVINALCGLCILLSAALWIASMRLLHIAAVDRRRHWQARASLQSGPTQASRARITYNSTYYDPTGNTVIARTTWPPTAPDAGIRAGEVRAFRCWHVDGPFLRSVIMKSLWIPGEPMRGDPAKGGGVHGFATVLRAMHYRQEQSIFEILVGDDNVECCDDIVVGVVELWGEVYEHEQGYRAEFGAIAGIVEQTGVDVAELCRIYDVPMLSVDFREKEK